MRPVLLAMGTLGVLALGLAGCGAREAETAVEAEPPTVTTVRPARSDAVRALTLPGDLIGWNEAALFAKVTGYLKTIDVDKGDWVKKGQGLAEIEVPELQQKLKRARANLQVRRVTYERLKGVWKTDPRLVAREDVDVAEGEFNQAQAEVEELEALVGYTKIIAPFDGVVTARYVDPGALIEANGRSGSSESPGGGKSGAVPVLALADIDRLRVYVYVPEQETSLVRRGMPAALTLREFQGREFRGTVARFSNALDLSTRTMLTEVDLENARHELYPGMYAEVSVELDRHPNAIELPATAVGGAGDDTFVFAVQDGSLSKVAVKTGIVDAGTIEITAGLMGDEMVVRNVGPALREGQRVTPVEAKQQAAGSTTTNEPANEGAHA